MFVEFTRTEAALLIAILDCYSNSNPDGFHDAKTMAWRVFDALKADMEVMPNDWIS